jgi:hypothetical protein
MPLLSYIFPRTIALALTVHYQYLNSICSVITEQALYKHRTSTVQSLALVLLCLGFFKSQPAICK